MGLETVTHNCDLCIVGGGLAGLSAAISAARGGSNVVLMQDRPMLGGNASSEIRMWVCGASGGDNRETGIIEEIQLESLYRNPDKVYGIWDGILWGKAHEEKNITLLLNCACCQAEMSDDGKKIVSVTGYQTTTQKWQKVNATYFSDCSGDSILAPLTGAEYRVGRESRDEFNEKTSQEIADRQTMGMSCLIQCRKTDRISKFIPPTWAKKMTPEVIKLRKPWMPNTSENFWYLELGGNKDSIADTEETRDELVSLAYGMFDYIKNSGEVEDADYWQLDFLGFLPGKRESRRMVGDYIMTQNDVLDGGKFDDTIAFGGWPLDDHHPDGFYHAGNPNVWGETPSPYGIPYRCVYSKNIDNLFFAGRNISLTHAAMSSARVMATCATLGESVGTAANLAREYNTSPRGIYKEHISELKERLMEQGCFLPGNKRTVSEFIKNAELTENGLENLRNGMDRTNRTYGESDQGVTVSLNHEIGYKFGKPQKISNIHIAFDSDLPRATLPGDGCERIHSMRANTVPESPTMTMPKTLAKSYKVEGLTENGEKVTVYEDTDNIRYCVNIKTDLTLTKLTVSVSETWDDSAKSVHILSFDAR